MITSIPLRSRPLGRALLFAVTAALTALSLTAQPASRERGQERDRRRSSGSATASAAPEATAPITPAAGFDAFQLILERNIFNPNRVGRTRATTEEKPPRVDEISLVGTMHYDKGVVAFFDSTEPAFKKSLRVGESVADFKVQSIAPDGVELLRGDTSLSLKVSQQLRRAEGGDWNVITLVPPPARTDASGGGRLESARPGVPATPEIPANASEVLKRLMQKREKQLSK